MVGFKIKSACFWYWYYSFSLVVACLNQCVRVVDFKELFMSFLVGLILS